MGSDVSGGAEKQIEKFMGTIIKIVHGYHQCTDRVEEAPRNGFTSRVAVVFETFRRDNVSMYFDSDLHAELVGGWSRLLESTHVTFCMRDGVEFQGVGELKSRYRQLVEEDRIPPRSVKYFRKNTLVGLSITEFWTLVGGPDPYHDSYTFSLYTKEPRVTETIALCKKLSAERKCELEGIIRAEPES